jgi:predicted porin
MQSKKMVALAAAGLAVCAGSAKAQDLEYHSGGLSAALHGAVSVQAGDVSGAPRNPGAKTSNLDGYVRVNVDWTSPQGWLAGVNLETSNRGRTTEALNSGEAYLYFSSDLGRIEIGRQDGAADDLSFHAPVVALGQVRGDFARYAGSQALLSAYDTGDAPKIIYLSPPIAGFRAGASWAPRDTRNSHDPNPLNRTLQRDAIELGMQYQRPVGDWVLGASAGYVHGKSDPSTGRHDMRSWTVGFDARRGPLRLGGAYVDRGDSNLHLAGFGQTEVNAGIGWLRDRWGVAGSVAVSRASTLDATTVGVGGFYNINSWSTLRADVVSFDERLGGGSDRNGVVLVTELEVHF